MSLSSCSVPGSRPTFELSADEVELGLGKPAPPLSSHACHLRFAPVPTWPSLLPWSHHLGGPSIFRWAHEVLVAQPAWFLPTLPPHTQGSGRVGLCALPSSLPLLTPSRVPRPHQDAEPFRGHPSCKTFPLHPLCFQSDGQRLHVASL